MWQLHTESCGKWRVNHPQWELWFAISPSWVWREKITWGIWQAEGLSMCIIILSTIVAIIRPISSSNSWTCLEIPIYIYIYIVYIYIIYIYIYITYISHYITIKWLMSGIFPLPPLCRLYIKCFHSHVSRQLQRPQRMPCNACGVPGGDMQKWPRDVPGMSLDVPEHERCPQIGPATIWWTNIAIENGHLSWIFPFFHCYVSSPEGTVAKLVQLQLYLWVD